MKYDEYGERIKGAVGNADALLRILNEVRDDADLTNIQRNRLVNSCNAHIKTATGKATLETDSRLGRNVKATIRKQDDVETLGFLCLPTVSETIDHIRIPNESVDAYWNEHGIADKFKPKPYRETDAFKKACDDFKGHEPVSAVVKSVFPNADRVIWDITQLNAREYQITRKIVSLIEGESKRDKTEMAELSYDKICKVIMDETTVDIPTRGGKTKKDTTYRYRAIPEKATYKKLTDEIFERFLERIELYKVNTSGKKIRDGIRATIQAHNGINFSGQGGTWFVPYHAESIMGEYQAFFKELEAKYTLNGGRARLFVLPLINDKDVQGQIEDDVTRTVEKRMDKLLEDTLQQLKNAENDSEAESVLIKKLKEHEENEAMLDTYKGILRKRISVTLSFKDTSSIKTKYGEPSGRVRALLDRLKSAESKE